MHQGKRSRQPGILRRGLKGENTIYTKPLPMAPANRIEAKGARGRRTSVSSDDANTPGPGHPGQRRLVVNTLISTVVQE